MGGQPGLAEGQAGVARQYREYSDDLTRKQQLLWLLRRKLGGLNGRFLLNGLLRMGVASLTMGVGMWGMAQLWQLPSLLLQAIVGTIVGIVLYLGASWLLRVEELTKFVGYGRRLWRR